MADPFRVTPLFPLAPLTRDSFLVGPVVAQNHQTGNGPLPMQGVTDVEELEEIVAPAAPVGCR